MKVYEHENVKYHFSRNSRKWEFVVSHDGRQKTFLFKCDGKLAADKVALQVQAGFKRTKGRDIDGLSRKSIDKIVFVDEVTVE
jgi:hypothetical protein